jgi:hypothetical protein
MTLLTRSLRLFALVGTAACATSNRVTTSSGPARWSGNFRTVGAPSSAVLNTRTTDSQGTAFGSISIMSADSTPPTSRVDLSVSAPAMSGKQLAWAIFSGPCGSPTPPVTGLQEFPALEIATGSGRVATDLRFRLSVGTEYHANVYMTSRATDVSNVLMCANLKLER